jgi:peptide/nickel transport system permease protein
MNSVLAETPEDGRPLWNFVRRFCASRRAVAGLVLLTLAISAAVIGPHLAPQNPYDLMQLDVMDGRLPPGSKMDAGFTAWLGSDDQGRDMLSGILYGLRISLIVGVTSALGAGLAGTALGMTAAYRGGWVDATIMRFVDLQLSFPSFLVALMVLALLGRGVANVILALILVEWSYYARVARSAALAERGRDYIEAARGLALSAPRILSRHLLPNCVPPLIIVATMQVARAITLEATLSFLGLGVPVTEPSLGLLVASGYQYMLSGQYWMSVYPGIALMLTILGINLVGDQLRNVLNPRSGQ